jgi:SHS2 domain-containing protein
MPYRFVEDEATADVCFEAWAEDLPTVFRDAGDAVVNVMIENIEDINPREQRRIQLQNDQLDLLLFNFLEQIVYYKDAEQLLLRMGDVRVDRARGGWEVLATASGERLDPARHHQSVDVKAVTLHHFGLVRTDGEWRAHVILDI